MLLGLDYVAVSAAAEMLEITMTADLFARLRVMEGEVLGCRGRRLGLLGLLGVKDKHETEQYPQQDRTEDDTENEPDHPDRAEVDQRDPEYQEKRKGANAFQEFHAADQGER